MKRYEQELLQMRGNSRLAAAPPTVSAPPPPRTAHLQVTVQTADGTPLPGAMVTVDKRTPRGRETVYVRMTDDAGQVEALPLPAGEPDTVFDILAAAGGYYREAHHGIAVIEELPAYTLILVPLP